MKDKEAIKLALELLKSAHVSTDLVWKRHDCVQALEAALDESHEQKIDWKAEYIEAVRLHNITLDELRESLAANINKEALKLALENAYLAGFDASGEGYNSEYPFGDKYQDPVENVDWKRTRDNYIANVLANDTTQERVAETDGKVHEDAYAYEIKEGTGWTLVYADAVHKYKMVSEDAVTQALYLHPPELAATERQVEILTDEQEVIRLIQQRDHAHEIIDKLCDAVLGVERSEWSSIYGFEDVVNEVGEKMMQLEKQEQRCEYCDGTGDVHDQTGEWRGVCVCEAGKALAKQEQGEPVGALILGGVYQTSEGFEFEEWDVEWNHKAVEALQEELVTSEPVTLMLHTTPQQRKPLWIDPNDKTQAKFLPNIGEPVLFCYGGKTYYGQHNGGSFQYVHGVTKHYYNTWECRWMSFPAAHNIQPDTGVEE